MTDQSDIGRMPSLRLSGIRAFLGRIDPNIRLIKLKFEESNILVSVIFDRKPDENEVEMISEATTEIAADFPDSKIFEKLEVEKNEIPLEGNISNGWIYRRYEKN